jgi:hypothetical protein
MHVLGIRSERSIQIMKSSKNTENEIWGMPCVVDHQNELVYIKCSSVITAMGIVHMVKHYYPGYKGQLVSMEYLESLKNEMIS